jgi:hypothetical protein
MSAAPLTADEERLAARVTELERVLAVVATSTRTCVTCAHLYLDSGQPCNSCCGGSGGRWESCGPDELMRRCLTGDAS